MVIQWDWMGLIRIYDGPLVMTVTVCYWKWPSIVDLPIKHGGFPVRKALVYQRVVMTFPLAIYCYPKASCILTNNLSHVFQGERLRWLSNNENGNFPSHHGLKNTMGWSSTTWTGTMTWAWSMIWNWKRSPGTTPDFPSFLPFLSISWVSRYFQTYHVAIWVWVKISYPN